MSSPTAEAPLRRLAPVMLGLAALWLLVPAWVLATRWDTVLAGHPAYLVLIVAALAVGLALSVAAARPRPRPRRSGPLRILLTALGVIGSVVVVGAIGWLRPFAASPEAAALARDGSEAVAVESSATSITLRPTDSEPGAALIVQPGARVDPRAYVPIAEQVAAAGHLVVIVKQPLNIGFLAIGAPEGIQSRHPALARWALAGHSLGGVAASQFVAGNPDKADGLVLWASYPLDSLADRDDLVVASISGSEDGLAVPGDIEASRADLPPDTTFVEVEGAVHAFFGDYGEQPGDGTATIGPAEAQAQIVEATLAVLTAIGSG
jgi:hypothetical protein